MPGQAVPGVGGFVVFHGLIPAAARPPYPEDPGVVLSEEIRAGFQESAAFFGGGDEDVRCPSFQFHHLPGDFPGCGFLEALADPVPGGLFRRGEEAGFVSSFEAVLEEVLEEGFGRVRGGLDPGAELVEDFQASWEGGCVLFLHVEGAAESQQGGSGGGGQGLVPVRMERQEAAFPPAPGQVGQGEGLADPVGAGVGEVFPFQVDSGSSQLPGEGCRWEEGSGAAGEAVEVDVQGLAEGVVLPGVVEVPGGFFQEFGEPFRGCSSGVLVEQVLFGFHYPPRFLA